MTHRATSNAGPAGEALLGRRDANHATGQPGSGLARGLRLLVIGVGVDDERSSQDAPDYRSVFTLREDKGLGTAETAFCLEVSEDVVKTRLRRARARIREDLYRRAGARNSAAFQFHLSRCDRVVDAVLARIT